MDAQITAALIMGIFTILWGWLGSSSASNFIYGSTHQPNVNAEVIPDRNNLHRAEFFVGNDGTAPATKLILTIQGPKAFSNYQFVRPPLESYQKLPTESNNSFQLSFDRFMNSGDTWILILNTTLVDHKTRAISGSYSIFVEYDQGSWNNEFPVNGLSPPAINAPKPPYQQLGLAILGWAVVAASLFIGIEIIMRRKKIIKFANNLSNKPSLSTTLIEDIYKVDYDTAKDILTEVQRQKARTLPI